MARFPAGTEKSPVVSHFAEGGPGRHMKARLAAGDVLVGGTLTEYARPSLIKIYRQAGFDFIYIETEHTLLEPSALADTVLAARDNGLPAVAKIPQLERAATAKLLDCGVVGIQLPRAESRDQIETLRDYMKFPPAGSRAAAPGLGNSDYGRGLDFARFMSDQDAESTLVVHIETRKGYENAAEVVSTPGVDMVYLGPGDFSVEMGRPGDWDHPDVVGPAEDILELCNAHNVPFGTTAAGIEGAGRWISRGARFFEAKGELEFIYEGATQLVGAYRAFIAGSG